METVEPTGDAKQAPLAFSNRWSATLFTAFASLPFFVIGLFMAGWILRDLWIYERIQGWEPTPATIEHADLESGRSAAGRRGGGRSTFRAAARYRYQFQGKTYQSDRVGIYEGKDNFGSFQRDRANELNQLVGRPGAVTAYVNPHDPSQAVLFRQLRPEMLAIRLLFATAFGTFGIWFLWTNLLKLRRHFRERRLCQQFNDEPWRWRESWNQRHMTHKNSKAWIALVAAAFWNAVTWPAYVVAVQSGELTPLMHLMIIPFLLGGAAVAGVAGYFWWQRLRWGVTELELETLPGVIGERFAGVLHVPRRIESRGGIALRLACTSASWEGKDSSTDWIWEQTRRPRRDRTVSTGGRTHVPVEFRIPPNLPDGGEAGVKWVLTAWAATEGVDYHVEFDVPVFKVAGGPAWGDATDGTRRRSGGPRKSLAEIATETGARLERDPSGRRVLHFGNARNFNVSIGMFAFAVAWVYLAVKVLSKNSLLAGAALLGIGAIAIVAAGRMSADSMRLEFSREGVEVTRRLLGVARRRRFAPQEIAGIRATSTGWVHNGVAYWHVELRDRQERRFKLVTSLMDGELAQDLAEHIVATAGISQSRSSSGSSRMELEGELPTDLRGG